MKHCKIRYRFQLDIGPGTVECTFEFQPTIDEEGLSTALCVRSSVTPRAFYYCYYYSSSSSPSSSSSSSSFSSSTSSSSSSSSSSYSSSFLLFFFFLFFFLIFFLALQFLVDLSLFQNCPPLHPSC